MRWRGILVVVVLSCLGCSGLSEGLVEWSTGMDIEVADDGTVVITNPDGTRQVVTQGDKAVVPADFPLPAPPGAPTLESVLVDESGKGPSSVTWRLTEGDVSDDVIAFYQAWFTEQVGVTVQRDDQNLAGMRTVALVAPVGGATHTVTFVDALGSRTVTLAVIPAPVEDAPPAQDPPAP